MTDAMRIRLGLSVIAACTAAIALYGVMRVVQKLLFPEADPALVIWSEHAGFFWRSWTVVYAGGMLGFATWVLSEKHAARVTSFLATAVPIAAAILALQGLLVP